MLISSSKLRPVLLHAAVDPLDLIPGLLGGMSIFLALIVGFCRWLSRHLFCLYLTFAHLVAVLEIVLLWKQLLVFKYCGVDAGVVSRDACFIPDFAFALF